MLLATIGSNQNKNQKLAITDNVLKKSNKGENMPHDNACDLRCLHLVATTILLSSRLNILKRSSCVWCWCWKKNHFFKPVESDIARQRNAEDIIATAFDMLSNEHCYIDVKAHAFKNYVCDWIGLVNVCSVFHVPTLDELCTTHSPDFPFYRDHKRSKDINNGLSAKELHQTIWTPNANCTDQIIRHYVTVSSNNTNF